MQRSAAKRQAVRHPTDIQVLHPLAHRRARRSLSRAPIGRVARGILALLLAWGLEAVAADRSFTVQPVITTNVVVVTNLVLVTITNRVVTTNVVIKTNVLSTIPKKKFKKAAQEATLPDLSWVPPADNFDWIQLKSGEWLKGRFKGMQERELEFDSEEMDEQTFDWKDIRQLRTHRAVDVLLVDDQEWAGQVTITPTEITMGGLMAQVAPRDQIQSLTPGGSRERNYWSGRASIGLTLRGGNTEQVEYNAQAHLQRRTPGTRLSVDYIGNASITESVESANNHRVNGEFDLWLSRRFYLLLPAAEYYKDPFQNLERRVTAGVGIGYDLINRPRVEWDVTVGPAYQHAWFVSTQPGEPSEKGTGAFVFGTRLDWDITRNIEFILEYRGQYTSRKVGETTHHSVTTLSFDLTKRFDLDVSLVWDRISDPKIGADGDQPKPDDYRLTVGLGVDF